MRSIFICLVLLGWPCIPGQLLGTGYFGPNVYLDQGGRRVDASPEFYWELEVKRLAAEFHPAEHLSIAPRDQSSEPGAEEIDHRKLTDQHSAAVDLQDFNDAIKQGYIKPPQPDKSVQQHRAARDAIESKSTGAPLPDEFDSEFKVYHQAAFAYRQGQEHWPEAVKIWEGLLKRPPEQRRYRSVWAAFMLGKVALKSNNPEAASWFQRTRELAKQRFIDSLGMAADSYGWEGRSEWKQGHNGKAAELFLTQLALGDESAIVSLKALIPDRQPVEGMVNYGPEFDEVSKWNDAQRRAANEQELAKLREAARDPLLRRLVTAHILSVASTPDYGSEGPDKASARRSVRWLSVVEQTKPTKFEDAEYLGWTAYNIGEYSTAERWLRLAQSDTPAAAWLRAKLQRRAGNLSEAAKSLSAAWQIVRDRAAYTEWRRRTPPGSEQDYLVDSEGGHWDLSQSASGDLGAIHLDRGDFVQALEILLQGKLWEDAAYVAERVLTADELKTYLDAHATDPNDEQQSKLRYLLGRRLVREDRYDEAARYLRKPYDKVLELYVKSLKDAADPNRDPKERARAFFDAAWLARYDGLELMGTEGAPDGFAEEGMFEMPDIAQQRLTGVYSMTDYNTQKVATVPVVLKVSAEERQRLASNRIRPDLRFHYRAIAGALAIKAADLLPNNSEELADVVNRAGLWVKEAEPKVADRYYGIIQRRCPKANIGQAAIHHRWFVDQSGPWSEAERKSRETLHNELNITDRSD